MGNLPKMKTEQQRQQTGAESLMPTYSQRADCTATLSNLGQLGSWSFLMNDDAVCPISLHCFLWKGTVIDTEVIVLPLPSTAL